MTKQKAIISLFDLSGYAVSPWLDNKVDKAFLFDMQHPQESIQEQIDKDQSVIRISGMADTWSDSIAFIKANYQVVFITSFPSCQLLAVSGNRWIKNRLATNPDYLEESMRLVYMARDYAEDQQIPYMIENPVSLISSQWRKPDYTFHPYEYGMYLTPEEAEHPLYPDYIQPYDAYTKLTCLWTGNGFVMPTPRPVDKTLVNGGDQYSLAYRKLGGKSLKTKNIRSATPRGFAKAAAIANGGVSWWKQ